MFSRLDLSILNLCNSIHNPILDKIMLFFTYSASDGFIWIAIILILLFFKNTRVYGFATLTALGVTMLLGNKLFKNHFDRDRPFVSFPALRILVESSGTNSFPSSHAATAFTVFGIFYFFNLEYKWVVFIFALGISLSRVYLNLHYFSDIVAGAILGLLVSYIIFMITKKIIKYSKKPVVENIN